VIVKVADGYIAIDTEAEQIPSDATRDEVASMILDHAAAPVLTVAEVLTHPQTKARELVVTAPTPQGDTWPVFSLPSAHSMLTPNRFAVLPAWDIRR
jgi:crotonobetainyl-CoA:carnitine CoA-transferase CaiB-like acyl-CoA transferase